MLLRRRLAQQNTKINQAAEFKCGSSANLRIKMPPALGSGLAAEKAAREEKNERKRKHVQFSDDGGGKGGGKGKGGTGGKGGKGKAKGKGGRIGEPVHREEEGEGDDDDGPDEYAEDEEEVMIGRKKKKGQDGEDDAYDEDEDEEGPRFLQGDVSGEESEGEERFNEAGEVIEAFNLKEEREVGHFDESGNFVWRKTEDSTDEWLKSMGGEAGMEAAIGQAAAAQRRQRLETAARHAKEEAEAEARGENGPGGLAGGGGSGDASALLLLRELRALLDGPGDSVVRALKRLAPPRRVPGWQQRRGPGPGKGGEKGGGRKAPGSASGAVAVSLGGGGGDSRSEAEVAAFGRVTECADRLLGLGEVDVYHMTRDELDEKLDQVALYEGVLSQKTKDTGCAFKSRERRSTSWKSAQRIYVCAALTCHRF